MYTVVPNYYKKFQCIADRCRHSCCIGWEIDVDEETMQRYQTVAGDFGKRLSDAICDNDEPHFQLTKEERCPFLNEENLCDIILELGEDWLCQICRDHPRFVNCFSYGDEIGLGLCCEAAGELILGCREPFAPVVSGNRRLTEEEQLFLKHRDEIFSLLTDRNLSFDSRLQQLLQKYNLVFPEKTPREWAGIFLSLEHMDEQWCRLLEQLSDCDFSFSTPFDTALSDTVWEQLLIYFLYRHLFGALEDGSWKERILFSVLSLFMIRSLSRIQSFGESFSIGTLVEIARLYSAEIEYSEENTTALFAIFKS